MVENMFRICCIIVPQSKVPSLPQQPGVCWVVFFSLLMIDLLIIFIFEHGLCAREFSGFVQATPL
jgi:hypothetical protein